MKTWIAIVMCVAGLSLAGCSQQSKEHSEREAGKAAYHFAQGAKKAAQKAGHELRVAGEEAHQGWKQASRESKERGK